MIAPGTILPKLLLSALQCLSGLLLIVLLLSRSKILLEGKNTFRKLLLQCFTFCLRLKQGCHLMNESNWQNNLRESYTGRWLSGSHSFLLKCDHELHEKIPIVFEVIVPLSSFRESISDRPLWPGPLQATVLYRGLTTPTPDLLQSGPSIRHNGCSRETLQCGCNLRRSPFMLLSAFPSEQLRRRPSRFRVVEKWAISSTPPTNLCPGDRGRHSKDNPCVVQLHCCHLALTIALWKNLFSCLRRSDRRERNGGMGHVCS